MGAFHLDVSAHFTLLFVLLWWEIGLGEERREGNASSLEELGMVQTPSLPLTAVLFPYQQSKLEKADILEMTVKHLQNIQSSKMLGECLLP